MTHKDIRRSLEIALENHPYILRTDPFRKQLDGLSPGVLANLDSIGLGPQDMFYVGRKAAYETSAYIDWLANRICHRKERQ